MTSGSGIIRRLLEDVPIPRVVKIQQRYDRPVMSDAAEEFLRQLRQSGVLAAVKPGMSIAIGIGSRGIANQPLIVRLLVQALKDTGAVPFIFPAMGSHGGATAVGQLDLLERMGDFRTDNGGPGAGNHGGGTHCYGGQRPSPTGWTPTPQWLMPLF